MSLIGLLAGPTTARPSPDSKPVSGDSLVTPRPGYSFFNLNGKSLYNYEIVPRHTAPSGPLGKRGPYANTFFNFNPTPTKLVEESEKNATIVDSSEEEESAESSEETSEEISNEEEESEESEEDKNEEESDELEEEEESEELEEEEEESEELENEDDEDEAEEEGQTEEENEEEEEGEEENEEEQEEGQSVELELEIDNEVINGTTLDDIDDDEVSHTTLEPSTDAEEEEKEEKDEIDENEEEEGKKSEIFQKIKVNKKVKSHHHHHHGKNSTVATSRHKHIAKHGHSSKASITHRLHNSTRVYSKHHKNSSRQQSEKESSETMVKLVKLYKSKKNGTLLLNSTDASVDIPDLHSSENGFNTTDSDDQESAELDLVRQLNETTTSTAIKTSSTGYGYKKIYFSSSNPVKEVETSSSASKVQFLNSTDDGSSEEMLSTTLAPDVEEELVKNETNETTKTETESQKSYVKIIGDRKLATARPSYFNRFIQNKASSGMTTEVKKPAPILTGVFAAPKVVQVTSTSKPIHHHHHVHKTPVVATVRPALPLSVRIRPNAKPAQKIMILNKRP